MLVMSWLRRCCQALGIVSKSQRQRRLRRTLASRRRLEALEARFVLAAPQLTASVLAVSENASVGVTTANLNATDADNDTLTFNVTIVANGRFERVGAPGVVITSFTLAEVTNGDILFVHDGSELVPAFDVSVTDSVTPTAPVAASISFTHVNDQTPTFVNSTLTISEGATLPLTTAQINATDADQPGDSLSFAVSNVTRGRFELVSNPGTAISGFSLAGINAGNVRFVHDGTEQAPTFDIAVSDGLNSVSRVGTVAFTNVNDIAPVLTVNRLSVEEGATVALTTADLEATDADLPPDALSYLVSNLNRGRIELSTAPGIAITTISRADLVAGFVRFVQDGSEQAPTYSIAVTDGVHTTTPAAATISFTNANDQTPVVTARTLTINEGATATLSLTNLDATDGDLPGDTLSFVVSGVTRGRFERSTAAGTTITTFLRSEVSAGTIRFVHDGGETAPAFNVAASDGTNTSAAAAATINFTNVNDAPTLTANALTLSEGTSVTLSVANIAATDPDLPANTITFVVSNVTRGQFELSTAPGSAVTSFNTTQVGAGQVRFVHDGSEFAPTYSVAVGDGTVTSSPAAATINFTNVNDQTPTVTANSLTISEGATVTLATSNVNATDGDQPGDTLTFNVSGVSGGRFERSTAAGTPITSFLRSEVVAGTIRFVHDGGEAAPTYSVSVSDGANSTAPAAATITFTNVNDAPVLTANTLTISEGGSAVLSPANLNATDADLPANTITFAVSNLARGRFERLSAAGVAITSFTRTEVSNGEIQFVHDGSESAPTYSVSVSDGTTATTAAAATVAFSNVNDQPPVLTASRLVVSEGGTSILNAAQLDATDPDLPGDTLVFNVSNVTGGRFERTTDPGNPVLSFSKTAVTNGTIRFVQDGSEGAPAFNVSVSDGVRSTTPVAATAQFTPVNDQPPSLTANALTIAENATVVLTTAHLNAADADLPGDTLTFTVSNVTRGRFERTTAPGTPITSFTRSEVEAGTIRFVHDGSELAPTFSTSVSDGVTATPVAAATISFTNVNDQTPQLTANALTNTEGQAVVLTTANLNATDADIPAGTLTFQVAGTPRGQFEMVAAPGVAVTSFTLDDVTHSRVRFVHDGGELPPAYMIAVTDGTNTSAAAPANVAFTNVNDQTPALTASTLTIAEGATVVLTTTHLDATDADLPGDTLTFTVSVVTGGRFERTTAAGTPITTFTRTEVVAGAVRFVHDNGENPPAFQVSVGDGVRSTPATAATINFTNVNDQTPVLSPVTLTVAEGATVPLLISNVDATDADLPGDTLSFVVSNVTRGRFELTTAAGTAITTFTRAALFAGQVQFVHDGTEGAPTFSIAATDGARTSAAAAGTITFTNVNDQPPVLTASSLTIAEGGAVALSTTNFNATDADLPGDVLTFQVTSVTGGQFERTATPGTAITSFTRTEIAAGAIRFVHDGGEQAPAFQVAVFDGAQATTPIAGTLTFTNVNDQAPVLTASTVPVTENGSTILTSTMLEATDADLPGDALSFLVSNVTRGRFELTTAAGTAITSFTRANLVAGRVRFVHDGSEFAPTFNVAVTDGVQTTTAVAATVPFTPVNDQTPVLTANAAAVTEGGTLTLDLTNLNATDADLPGDTLTFTVSNVTRGRFELVSNPGTQLTSFTRSDVANRNVIFIHDGTEGAPTWSVSVNDGARSTTPAAATITYTSVNDETPVITANTLVITEGGTATLSTARLNATDADLPADTLSFNVSNVTGGRFESTAAPGVAIFSFTRAAVAAGTVRFVHDGNEAAPTYDVVATDGTNSSAASAAVVTFTNVNDQPPALTASTLTLLEGATVDLAAANLDASDADLPGDTLTFTVSNVARGRFEFRNSPGAAITRFTRANIAAGDVRFVHDGGEAAPTFNVSVSDGVRSTATVAATINFTNVNDVPVLTANTFAVSEGGSVVLSTSNLNATDADLPGDTLSFNILSVTNGRFELTTAPGAAINGFTRAALVAGTVRFVHDGGELAPTASISVTDGADSSPAAATSITFANVNDQPPVLATNNLTLTEGSSTILTTANLDATDADLPGDTLTFVVSNVSRGRFELTTAPGVAISSFTRANLVASRVRFVHDGGEAPPTYNIAVNDGVRSTAPSAATVTFTNVNDAPTLTASNLTISEGGIVLISLGNFNAADVDLPGDTLTFTVNNVANGRFEFVSTPGTAVTSFSRANVQAGNVRFVHDGGELPPAIQVSVSDGLATTAFVNAAISFTNVPDPPTLLVNRLTVTEGAATIVSTGDLDAFDPDLPAETLTFTVSNVTRGRFELPAAPGTPVTRFTRSDIIAGRLRFLHDGTEGAPTYSVSVSDGARATAPQAAAITYVGLNDPPTLTASTLAISEGATVVLSTANLDATDPDIPVDTLTFTVSGLSHGQFELSSAAGVPAMSFSKADVLAGNVRFVHDGSEFAPTFNVSVSDGTVTTPTVAGSVSFINVNDAPVFVANDFPITEGGSLILSGANLNADDPDLGGTITFTISNLTGGRFELITAPGSAITSFTRTLAVTGRVRFVHDGGEAPPAFRIAASDGVNVTAPVAANVTFTSQNDPPLLTAGRLTVVEGATVTLTAASFGATDPDQPGDPLRFIVSGVSNGQFELSNNPGMAITEFTPAELLAGQVRFAHDGSETAPAGSVLVTDGTDATNPVPISVTFTNVNDAPTLVSANLTISEGGSRLLSAADFVATDPDLPGDALSFLVSNVTAGRFESTSAPGTAITSFSRTNLVAGRVRFVHDGTEMPPSFAVAVSDGAVATAPTAATISFTNLNDAPTLTVNALSIAEGGTSRVTATDLNATDSDPTNDTISFNVSGVTRGRFELLTAPGVAISTFALSDVTAGNVQFVHDGGEAAPTYLVSATDGRVATAPQAAAITFAAVNDETPVLTAKSLSIAENAVVTITSTMLNATDADLSGDTLTFTVTNLTHGRFERTSAPGVEITRFTKADIAAGLVRFAHDASEFAPSFDVSVGDGFHDTAPVAATITFQRVNDQVPVLLTNALTIAEGGTVVLSTADLEATDADLPGDTLTFVISGLAHGRFERDAVAVSSFTRNELVAGRIRFVHDGGEGVPAYNVSVGDGARFTTPAAATINYTGVNDQPPILSTNALQVQEGGAVVVTAAMLNATDADLPADTLTFTVANVTRGQFERIGAPGAAVNTFTRTDITAGQIQFVHDGTENIPTFTVSVSDGLRNTTPVAGIVVFRGVNDQLPTLTASALTVVENGSFALTTANLDATDADLPGDTLTFTITGLANGRFERNGAAVNSFTRADVVAGLVRFVHDGSELAPTAIVTLSDGVHTSAPVAMSIGFTNVNDQTPVLTVNPLSITNGTTLPLTTAQLDATDGDLPGDTLTITVSNVTNGRFERTTAPGVATNTFTRAELVAGNIRFAHDGGGRAPSFGVSVSDGARSTAPVSPVIRLGQPPRISGVSTTGLNIFRGRTPTLLAFAAQVADPDNVVFDGGVLSIGYAGGNVDAGDRFTIIGQGDGRGQVGVSGNEVRYGGVVVGTITGGIGAALKVRFNGQATSLAVQAVLRRAAVSTISGTPLRVARNVEISLSDGNGGVSNVASRRVTTL